MYKFLIMGDKYGRRDQNLYLQDVESAKQGLLLRPPLAQRQSQIEFTVLDGNNGLRCAVPRNASLGEGTLVCDVAKIQRVIGNIPFDSIIILVNGAGFGSGDSPVATIGTGGHDNSAATNASLGGTFSTRLDSIVAHEVGHAAFLMGHVLPFGGVMGTPCNGGGCVVLEPYYQPHMDMINQRLDSIAGAFNDVENPVVSIINPLDNANISSGTQIPLRFTATDNTGVMKFEVLIDDVAVSTTDTANIVWARNPFANTPTAPFLRSFPIITPLGAHTIKVKAYDAAYNVGEDSITVNVI